MPISLEDKEGKPWTASAGIAWLTLAADRSISLNLRK
jgi:hypothetical protein